jgi:VanZ family protein
MFVRHNLLGILWMLVILIFTVAPGSQIPESPFLSFDKFFHTLVYAVLSFQLAIGFKKQYQFKKMRRNAGFYSFAFSLFYGGATEFLQEVAGTARAGELSDFLANAIGCTAGILAYYAIFWPVLLGRQKY